jgi:hypothetical protein
MAYLKWTLPLSPLPSGNHAGQVCLLPSVGADAPIADAIDEKEFNYACKLEHARSRAWPAPDLPNQIPEMTLGLISNLGGWCTPTRRHVSHVQFLGHFGVVCLIVPSEAFGIVRFGLVAS